MLLVTLVLLLPGPANSGLLLRPSLPRTSIITMAPKEFLLDALKAYDQKKGAEADRRAVVGSLAGSFAGGLVGLAARVEMYTRERG